MGKKTALLAAAMYDHVQVVRLLVDRGAELLPPYYVSLYTFLTYHLENCYASTNAKYTMCVIERVSAALGSRRKRRRTCLLCTTPPGSCQLRLPQS